jgi:hypothetical protein
MRGAVVDRRPGVGFAIRQFLPTAAARCRHGPPSWPVPSSQAIENKNYFLGDRMARRLQTIESSLFNLALV